MNKNLQNSKGKLIILCGGEGSGKSSIAKDLQKAFPNTIMTREPGGTPYAENIRDNMFKNPLAKNANAETMFGQAWSARSEHMHHLVIPALDEGKNVIVDRFDCCTYAYQLHAQGGEHLENLFWHTREAYLRAKVPDLYIFLDVSPEIGLKRVAGRAGKKNHFDERDLAFHNTVRRGYHSFFEKLQEISDDGDVTDAAGKSGFIVIDASRPYEDVCSEIVGIVSDLIK